MNQPGRIDPGKGAVLLCRIQSLRSDRPAGLESLPEAVDHCKAARADVPLSARDGGVRDPLLCLLRTIFQCEPALQLEMELASPNPYQFHKAAAGLQATPQEDQSCLQVVFDIG